MSPAPEGPPEGRTGWEALDRWVKDDGGGSAGAGEGGEGGAPLPPTCTTCAGPLEEDQTYCLDCGTPTPLAPRLARSGRSVAILAVALAALGIGAGALAYAVAQGDDSASRVDTVTTSEPGTPLPTDTGFGTLPADTTGGFPSTGTTPLIPPTTTGFGTTTSGVPPVTTGGTTTTATTIPTTPTTPSGGAGDWPAGRTAWTAQVSSVRVRGAAEALRTRLRASGEEAGLLFSTGFDELRPGYYVVFSGTFDSRAEAIAHAASLRGRHPGVFARRLAG